MRVGRANLGDVVQFLDDYFRVLDLPVDPAFSRFVPMVYDPISFPWRDRFEPEFTQRFNGLMLRGRDDVGTVWCIAFPHHALLDTILGTAQPGDLIFSHHPIDMRCGDPRGPKGAGFVPIAPEQVQRIRDAGISFYSCHIPLDTHPATSTSDALVRALGGTVIGSCLEVGNGYAGRVCEVEPRHLDALIETCKRAVGLPYVDCVGNRHKNRITRITVIAGGAGDVAFYAEADKMGSDCLIAGEVTSKIDNEIGERKQAEIERYLPTTDLAAIGVSHAGSEFVVMREVAPLLAERFGVAAVAVPEPYWWR